MAGRQAKTLSNGELLNALRATRRTRYPLRDRVMLLLSTKAGLRAAEIAGRSDWLTEAGDLRTLPGFNPGLAEDLGGMDGFFAARLVATG